MRSFLTGSYLLPLWKTYFQVNVQSAEIWNAKIIIQINEGTASGEKFLLNRVIRTFKTSFLYLNFF